MRLELDLDFKKHFSPENFFFGVANAPYLAEGGYNTPEGFKNSYAELELNDKIERSGEAVRFWTDYEEQIKLAASLGLNAFRMGLDWSRIQPSPFTEPHDPPEWDQAALDHYAKIVATVIEHGMQPVITLHHFLHPAWLGADMWLHDEGPDLLAEFEIRVVAEINRRLLEMDVQIMNHFLVYNEPNLVPFIFHWNGLFPIEQKNPLHLVQAYDNMFSRYVRIYDGLYDLFERQGWGEPHIGVTMASMCAYEMDKFFFDLLRVRSFSIERGDVAAKMGEFRETWNQRVGELAKSKLTEAQYQRYLDLIGLTSMVVQPDYLTKTLEALYASPRAKKLDYISLNVYEPFGPVKGTPDELPPMWENAVDGEIYRTFILAENDFNTDLPVYMGENGLCYEQPKGETAQPRIDGCTREQYFKIYLMEMVKCIKEGVPIKGYLYWSLVDDFEWEAGYAPRLGLFNYDYENHKILETDGLGEPAGPIYAHLIAALRRGDKETVAKAFTRKFS